MFHLFPWIGDVYLLSPFLSLRAWCFSSFTTQLVSAYRSLLASSWSCETTWLWNFVKASVAETRPSEASLRHCCTAEVCRSSAAAIASRKPKHKTWKRTNPHHRCWARSTKSAASSPLKERPQHRNWLFELSVFFYKNLTAMNNTSWKFWISRGSRTRKFPSMYPIAWRFQTKREWVKNKQLDYWPMFINLTNTEAKGDPTETVDIDILARSRPSVLLHARHPFWQQLPQLPALQLDAQSEGSFTKHWVCKKHHCATKKKRIQWCLFSLQWPSQRLRSIEKPSAIQTKPREIYHADVWRGLKRFWRTLRTEVE